MLWKKYKINILNKSIDKLNKTLEESNFIELSYLIGNKKRINYEKLYCRNIKGIGIGIGVTIITAILIMILQKIVTLNIPVIGEYVADIVEIVEKLQNKNT